MSNQDLIWQWIQEGIIVPHGNNKVRKSSSIMPVMQKIGKDNRRRVSITHNKQTATITLARLIWMLHNKKRIPDGYEIHHKDLDPTNDDINNLQLVTDVEHKRLHRQQKQLPLANEEQILEWLDEGLLTITERNNHVELRWAGQRITTSTAHKRLTISLVRQGIKIRIKVSSLVWLHHHRTLPRKGCRLEHLDGNKKNCTLNNLVEIQDKSYSPKNLARAIRIAQM